jgi:hypothetical protein
MIGVSLGIFVVLGQVSPQASPADLVVRLGAPRYAEREAASGQLERLGRGALTALRTARELSDPEVRTRAAGLISKIEGALLTQPTLITLDFENRPIQEVLGAVSEQAGVKLTLFPENMPQWGTRRVTVHEKAPLPFWKAIDRLCDVARLQYNLGMNGLPNGREPSFPLFDGARRPSAPAFDTGPFRVNVLGLHYQRDVSFPPVEVGMGNAATPPRPVPATTPSSRVAPSVHEQCFAQIQVSGEPRLSLSQTGTLKLVEAVDDRGQSLLAGTGLGGVAQRSAAYAGFGMSNGPVLQFQALLSRPEVPGKTIRRLRGVLPVLVATRKSNPLVVKLNGANGRTFRNDDVALTIHDVHPLGNTRQMSIELTVRPLSGSGGGPPTAAGPGDFLVHRPDTSHQQIEVSDAHGRVLHWYQTSFDSEASRMTLTMTPQAPELNGPPAELRFYGLARSATEISFEFNNLPLP